MNGGKLMKLNKYFAIGLAVFILGVFGLYTGLNHPSGAKVPVLQKDHTMQHSQGK